MGLVPAAVRGQVLLVDDEAAILRSAAALLEDDHTVHTASGVREAVAILDEHAIDVVVTDFHMRVDVVVTDFHMRDGTGEQVVCRIGATERTVFTILVTGWLESPAVMALCRSNLVLALAKPVAPDVLIGWVCHGLALARLSAATRSSRRAHADRGVTAPGA